MRIIVISDSHGRKKAVEDILYLHEKVQHVIFLGDGLRDLEDMEYIFPERTFYKVAGNCDWLSDENTSGMIELAGKRIFYTHGHIYGVKSGIGPFKNVARQHGADIALYGHTHQPYTEYDDGLYVINPGSASPAGDGKVCYGIIDIEKGGIITIPATL